VSSSTLSRAIDAARAAVKAHLRLKQASADGAAKEAKLRHQKVLFRAMEELTTAMYDLEKELSSKPKKDAKPFPWMSALKAADGFLGILAKARRGTLGPKDVAGYARDAASSIRDPDIVDAEIVE
jgi:hypothetical protein